MITEIEDMPANAVGFSLEDTVTAEDYHAVFIPVTEAALKAGHKVSLLIFAGPAFKGYAPAAMWDDTAFGFRHFFDFEKIAFVSDNETYGTMVRSIGILMPAMVRVFETSQLDEAKAWLAGD